MITDGLGQVTFTYAGGAGNDDVLTLLDKIECEQTLQVISVLIEDSILQFKGNIPHDIRSIHIKFISEFHVEYLFLSDSSDLEAISSDMEDILHDILTNAGLETNDRGDVIGFRFDIDYKFFVLPLELEKSIEGKDVVCIYSA